MSNFECPTSSLSGGSPFMLVVADEWSHQHQACLGERKRELG